MHSQLRQVREDAPSPRPSSTWRPGLKLRSWLLFAFLVASSAALYYPYAISTELVPGSSTAHDALRELVYDASTLSVLNDTDWPAFELVDLPGRGKGLVAVRDIQQGERLMREYPLLSVSISADTDFKKLLSDLAQALPAARQAAFFSLSAAPRHIPPSLDAAAFEAQLPIAIFQTNAVAVASGHTAGLFPLMARMNHGCAGAFNAVYHWPVEDEPLVVHALKPIRAGEEVLTTYTDTKRKRVDRRALLHDNYGFECQCSTCSLAANASEASDARLVRMAELYGLLTTWAHGAIDGAEAERVAREIWSVGEEEGYWGERGRLASDLVYVAAAHSSASAAEQWAELGRVWYTKELGAESAEAVELSQLLQTGVNTHTAWGTRTHELLGGPGSH